MEILIQTALAAVSAIATGTVGYFFYKFKHYEKLAKVENEKQLQEILRRDDAVVGALRALCSERILQIYIDNKKKKNITKQKMDMAEKLYKAYHKLGATALLQRFLKVFCKFRLRRTNKMKSLDMNRIIAWGLIIMGILLVGGWIAFAVLSGTSSGTEIPIAISSGLIGVLTGKNLPKDESKKTE